MTSLCVGAKWCSSAVLHAVPRCAVLPHAYPPFRSKQRATAGFRSTGRARLQCRAVDKEGIVDAEATQLHWSPTTVVENKAASADESVRTLVLSVEDHVEYLDGLKVKRRQAAPRWVDSFTAPGQFVAIKASDDSQPCPASVKPSDEHMFAISSSPFDARLESSQLDATIIEVLVDRKGSERAQYLASLEPGTVIQVSHVLGSGFASLFNSHMTLMTALEEQRNLLMLCYGTKGIGPVRSVLEWAPVQAHSTAHRVSLVYVTESKVSAAYLPEWDTWREGGVHVHPVYIDDNGAGAAAVVMPGQILKLLEQTLFEGEHGLSGLVGGQAEDCVVLMAGLPGTVASDLSRELAQCGVERERILFCEFF